MYPYIFSHMWSAHLPSCVGNIVPLKPKHSAVDIVIAILHYGSSVCYLSSD